MKISQPDVVSNLLQANKNNQKNTPAGKGVFDAMTAEAMDRFEKGAKDAGSPAYGNPALDMNALAVQNLMNESEDIQNSVNQLITDMLKRQGYTEEQIKSGDFEALDVDEIARQKAAEMIGPGGELSPEKVSDRIVQFAIGVFGGDKSKIDIIRGSIDRGFGEAEKILGELADVSKETYTMIQDKLDAWIEGEGAGESEGETENEAE